MSKLDKKYTNGEITVYWKPDICIHSAKCFRALPEVFDPRRRPWIIAINSTTDKIIETVNNCPSGAISFKYNSELEKENMNQDNEQVTAEVKVESQAPNVRINVTANGPLMVNGTCVITDKDGTETIKEGKFALCRCGASSKKPFCDGTHKTLTFDI